MAWKERRGRRYYYRNRRIGSTVRSEYVGAGPLAPIAALVDAIKRAEREERRRWQHAEQEAEAVVDRQIDELGVHVQELVSAVLIVAGYHRHKREWRKQRASGN